MIRWAYWLLWLWGTSNGLGTRYCHCLLIIWWWKVQNVYYSRKYDV